MGQNEKLKLELKAKASLESEDKYNLPRQEQSQSGDIAKMQSEMENLQKMLEVYQQSHGNNNCVQT